MTPITLCRRSRSRALRVMLPARGTKCEHARTNTAELPQLKTSAMKKTECLQLQHGNPLKCCTLTKHAIGECHDSSVQASNTPKTNSGTQHYI